MDPEGVGKRLVERVGQTVLTCPTTACFNGLNAEDTVDVGGQLRYFGDGYQASKVLDGRRYWRVPVMEGEFLVQERFGVVEGVAGGNIIIFGREHETALLAAQAAASAMRTVEGAIMPFPADRRSGGDRLAPALLPASRQRRAVRRCAGRSTHRRAPNVEAVFEIVIDGRARAVRETMRRGLVAAAQAGASHVTAGQLRRQPRPHHIHLRELVPRRSPSPCAAAVVPLEPGAVSDRSRGDQGEIEALRCGTATSARGGRVLCGLRDRRRRSPRGDLSRVSSSRRR
jgi:formylmethanofuran--tetrahydromethanopterin N-formyltransferase